MGGRKFKRRNIKNAERKKSASLKLIVAIPRNRINVAVSEGLALSQLVPESLSPVDVLSEVVPESLCPVESLPVCLPMSILTAGLVESLYFLYNRIARVTLPTSWVVFNSDGSSMSISKLVSQGSGKATTIALSVVVDMDMQWCIHTLHRQLHVPMCSLLSGMPILLNSVDSVFTILNFLDNTKFCAGNPDKDLVAVWYQQMLSLHGCSGNCEPSSKCSLLNQT